MKKQLLAISLGLITIGSFAQKKELRAVEKALKGNDFTTALSTINSLSSSIDGADNKYKAQYYFLKGKTFAGKKNYTGAIEALKQLLDFEKKIGKKKYSTDATAMMGTIARKVSERANDLYQNKKDYRGASKDFYLTYQLSPKDTIFAYYSAVSATQAKDYDLAVKRYKELQKIGYTGVETTYLATNKSTGKQESFPSKAMRDVAIRSKSHIKPEQKYSESKQGTIMKQIALILKEQGRTDEAIAAIAEARRANPKDENLIFAAAEIYQKLNKMDEFGKLMEEAIALKPNDPVLYYNLGVVNSKVNPQKAKEYYKKAIELHPNYADAYMNMAAAILDGEQAIVDKMNALPASSMKKYDAFEAQRKELFKEALPFLEKADELNRSEATLKTLRSIYLSLGNNAKASEYKRLLDEQRM